MITAFTRADQTIAGSGGFFHDEALLQNDVVHVYARVPLFVMGENLNGSGRSHFGARMTRAFFVSPKEKET